MSSTSESTTSDSNAPTAPRRLVGRPFKPGQSGNPGGRPRGIASLVRSRTRDGRMLVSFMIDVLTGKPQKVDMVIPAVTEAGEPTTKRITVEKTPEVRDRIAAAQWLGDRGWGRAIQQVDFTQSKPFIIQHRQFPPGHDPLAEPVDAESVSIVPVKALEEQR